MALGYQGERARNCFFLLPKLVSSLDRCPRELEI